MKQRSKAESGNKYALQTHKSRCNVPRIRFKVTHAPLRKPISQLSRVNGSPNP